MSDFPQEYYDLLERRNALQTVLGTLEQEPLHPGVAVAAPDVDPDAARRELAEIQAALNRLLSGHSQLTDGPDAPTSEGEA